MELLLGLERNNKAVSRTTHDILYKVPFNSELTGYWLVVTVTGWCLTKSPIHCDHFLIYCAPHLRCNHFLFIHQNSLAVTSRDI
jgi:hypothetical protein